VGQEAGEEWPTLDIYWHIFRETRIKQINRDLGPHFPGPLVQPVPDHCLDQAVDREAVGCASHIHQGIALERGQGVVPGQVVRHRSGQRLGQ
jgi:hypothetical protein